MGNLPARQEPTALERWSASQDLATPMVSDYADWSPERLTEWATDAVPEAARLGRITESARHHVGLVLWRLRQVTEDQAWGALLVSIGDKGGCSPKTLGKWLTDTQKKLNLPAPTRRAEAQGSRRAEEQKALASGQDSVTQKQAEEEDETEERVVPATPGGNAGRAATASKVAPKVSDSKADMRQDGEPSGGTSGPDTPSEDSQPKTVAAGAFGTTSEDMRAAAALLILMGAESIAHCLTPEQIRKLRVLLPSDDGAPAEMEATWKAWMRSLLAEPAKSHTADWWKKMARNRMAEMNPAVINKVREI